MLRACLSLSHVLVSCSCVLIPLFMGRPASPFIGEEKVQVTEEEKKKNEREKKAFRVAGSFFSFIRSRRSCRCQQGWLYVMALFVTAAMCRHHLPVMVFHSVLADVVVN